MNAFDAAEKNGRASDLQKELEALFTSQNKSQKKGVTSIPATFLRVTVTLNSCPLWVRHMQRKRLSALPQKRTTVITSL